MNANNFSFSNATFDYYLSKASDGSSTMRVEEVLTAEFPTYDQNHGIERCLPTKYRGVKSLDKSSFSVYRTEDGTSASEHALTRSDYTEPFSTYTDGELTCFRIGSASSYVHGTQTYTLNYTLNNVILAPDNSENQELYWDINGTGWDQPFYNLTARVHLAPSLKSSFLGSTSCYIGAYGTSGSAATSRCTTETSADGLTITFKNQTSTLPGETMSVDLEFAEDSFATASVLAPRETMTVDLEFAPESFVVKKDMTPLATLCCFLLGLLALVIASVRSHFKAKSRNSEKVALAKTPKPPQYVPPEKLSVAEAATVWFKTPSGDLKIATLLELAVRHKIELEKAEKTSKILKRKSNVWKIHAKDLSGILSEEQNVLDILNGGSKVKTGDVIEVKTQSYSSHVARLATSYLTNVESTLLSKGLFEEKKNKKFFFLAPKYNKYEKRTKKGIEVSNYLDGLKEYIELAEKDRIKFLHSVPNLDVSNAGIAKLYEKLLPYAIIFGCETTWLEELNKYYQMPDVTDPDWLMTGYLLSSSDFHAFRSSASSSISSATVSSSSGSSGGGGGGFSGGGGGGGGGGGW